MMEPGSEYWLVIVEETSYKFTNHGAAHDYADEKRAQGKNVTVIHSFKTASAATYRRARAN